MSDKPLFGENMIVPILLVIPVVLLAIGGIWALRERPQFMAKLQRGESEGRAFATPNKKTAGECLDGALLALDRFDDPPEAGSAAFLEACLTASDLPKTTGAKHSAPTRGMLEGWARDECNGRGRSGDKHCSLLLQLSNVDPCGALFRAHVRASPAWSCAP